MQIHRMTASFGKFQGESLELKDGLNILQAPNETGKSTWCAFLLSMLYGINSRERDRAGFIADKNKYAPWSGAAMSGRLDCCADGTQMTLTRATRRQTAPMGEFQAVYSGTGNTVPELNGTNCGEILLGVTREVYERSAFIRQSSLSISQDAGLERRIAALITSGEEDTSYSETADTLKKQLNRRRHNKTGQLPSLEAELDTVRRQLAEIRQLEEQLQSARAAIGTLEAQEDRLSTELEQLRLWEAAEKHRILTEALSVAEQAEKHAAALRQQAAESRLPENEAIARLRGALVNLETTRHAVEQKRSERDKAAKALLRVEDAVSQSPFAGQSAEHARNFEPPKVHAKLTAPILISLTLFAVLAAAIYLLSRQPLWMTAAILPAAGVLLPLANRAKKATRSAALIKQFGTTDSAEISTLAEKYIDLLTARDAAQAELDKRSAAADTLYNTLFSTEQAILLEIRRFAPAAFDVSTADELLRECARKRKAISDAETAAREARLRCDLLDHQLPPAPITEVPRPLRDRAAVTADLETVLGNLAISRSMADRLTGQLSAIGDPAILHSSAARLEDEIARLESEYSAIRLAMDALETANTTLQNRFSPALGKRAAEIFSKLTDGHYHGVILDRAFHLSAEPAGDTVYRDAQLLSAGTADQLYLATRLAICDLVLPADRHVPIILDDALTNFDDARCAAALRWLKNAAKDRQILLFTCHEREAAFFAGDEEVSIQRLTNRPKQV